jgi:HNH endonuclease/NUMOD3 motif
MGRPYGSKEHPLWTVRFDKFSNNYEIKTPKGWMPLQRFKIEEATGKPVPKGMIVHHKNGNHYDNRIENLQVVTPAEHNKIHFTGHASPNKGRKMSLEQRKKISESRKGYVMPEEQKKHLSKVLKGRTSPMKDRVRSAESNKKTAETMKKVRAEKFWSTRPKKRAK